MKAVKRFLRKNKYPLSVVLLTIVIVLFFSYGYHAPSIGTAIQEPPEEPLNLNQNGSFAIDVNRVDSWEVELKTSAGDENIYELQTQIQGNNLLYEINDGGLLLASGYLGKIVPDSRGLFLDADAEPDLELRYNADNFVLSVVNPLYVGPAAAEIRLLLSNGKLVEKPLPLPLLDEVTFTLEVSSSTSAPAVQVFFADASVNTSKVVQDLGVSGATRKQTVRWKPWEEKPYALKVQATVGGQVTEKNYLFGGNGAVYLLQDETQYPLMKVTLLDEPTQQARVDMTFPISASKQPFSLPCTKVAALEGEDAALTAEQRAVVSALFAYDVVTGKPLQWKENLPSDFTALESLRGYVLQTKQSQPLRLSLSCRLSTELPSLRRGWNLVAVTGYESVAQTALEGKVPPGERVRQVKELLRDEQSKAVITPLEPGKAYWVLVE